MAADAIYYKNTANTMAHILVIGKGLTSLTFPKMAASVLDVMTTVGWFICRRP